MSTLPKDSHAKGNNAAGAKPSIPTNKPKSNVDNGAINRLGSTPDKSSRNGVPEKFMVPKSMNRYPISERSIKKDKEIQPEFDRWKSTFEARMEGKEGPKPTAQEIANYSLHCEAIESKISNVNDFKELYSKEFKVTSLPKNIPEALELLHQMRSRRGNLVRPKGYLEDVALAAPGGVVDEAELDTDALSVQQSMMAEKQKALEEEGKNGVVNGVANGLVNNTGVSKKKKKKRKGKGQGKDQGKDDISSKESKGDGDQGESDKDECDKGESEGNDHIIPIEETLWYSPPHLSRLAKVLVQVASHLERQIGVERAIAALHTALTDEAMNVETVSQTLMAEGEYYYNQYESAKDDGILRKAAGYYERSAALGYEPALLKAGNIYYSLQDHTKARALLVEASDKGWCDLTMYTALGWYYLEGIGGRPDGKKADHYLAHFRSVGDTSLIQQQYLLRSRLYTYGLGPIKPDIVLAFTLLREALMINNNSIGKDMNWYDFYPLACGYRYGLLVNADPVKALEYYNKVLSTYQSCQVISSVAQPHLPRVLKEAKHYNEMMKRGMGRLLHDPQTRSTRFKHLLASLQHYPEQPQSILQHFLGLCYYQGDGVTQDLNMAKEYFIKASTHPKDPKRASAYCLATIYAKERNYDDMMKYLPLVDELSGDLPSDGLCRLYSQALEYCDAQVRGGDRSREAEWLKYTDKLILQRHPYGWYSKGRTYMVTQDMSIKTTLDKALCCFMNGEKLVLASVSRDDNKGQSPPDDVVFSLLNEEMKLILGYIYRCIGLCYLQEVKHMSEDGKEEKSIPLNREKGIMYLRKAVKLGDPRADFCLARTYYCARLNYRDPSNPGDPVKALNIYTRALYGCVRRGAISGDLACEYGLLLLMGHGSERHPPIVGLSWLEKATQDMLKRESKEEYEDVLIFTAILMDIYNEGLYGVPRDSKKGEMYMEHRKRIGGTKEIPPEYEEKIRYNNFILDTIDSLRKVG